MLDLLLVLGQVPGTNFQITFYEIVSFCTILTIWYFRRQLRRAFITAKDRLLAYLKQKAWQRRQLSLPV
jgi:hypothetical protein